MKKVKTLALVAHDNRKQDMIEWVEWNYKLLLAHKIVCTGTTGSLIEKALLKKISEDNSKEKLKPIKKLIFLWDPMEPQPHDVDVKALLRIAALYNIPIASNRSTADFIISSSLFNKEYEPVLKDYSTYLKREIKNKGE